MSSDGVDAVMREGETVQRPVPTRRFPEFRDGGEWSEKAGCALFDQITYRNANSNLPVLAITQEHGAIPRSLIDYHVSVTDKSIESYKVVRVGDFIISLRSFQGGIEYARYEGVCSPAYVVLRLRDRDVADYFRHYLKTDRFIKILTKNLEGLRDGKMISYAQFSELTFPVPRVEEQQKIADCLSSVDAVIAAEGERLAALRDHKKGLMQALFPAPGQTIPRLRFPKFQNARAWKKRLLGEIAHYQNGKAYEPHVVENGSYIVVNARFISTDGTVKKWSNNSLLIADEDDILMVLSDLPNGKALAKCYRVREGNRYAVNQRIARLTPHAVRSDFLFPVLNRHSYLLGFNDGMNQTHLSKDNVLTCPILLPPDEDEQIAIADCLATLDAQIAAQVDRLRATKSHKSGLIQQLFPSPAEAVA